ncbi:DMT family transporter [Heyndrickxia ginsengihumi]|uniref:Multidrug efflux SMR transporter n=1 Tax=Heyndrickxia ginsengihumi TaxID=363870 RepID=A0A0A6V854_9BACI|nr:multidrug efflux SMR transporter [Heyndrickxia ginsengihumi]KHD84245.1 supressor protein SugE [Heyndrickxia ginsengihumi]MBE6184567.1 multidrug efflux SMR transporter [Bacillus sp. (in: firmicutes)]MCM3022121.1 multidrug efflux SMR transporter [Heyndrickxia ginsengihumi]NEY18353.1 multidrug efflux SMR transporter [Heyndrickxia ginsengihumi]
MAWLYLITAGAGEIAFVLFMKVSNGFKRHTYTALSIISSLISLFCLSKALQTIPLSTAYSIWTGIGAAGSVLIGIIFFREGRSLRKLLFIILIIIGVVGLKIVE